MPARIEAPIDYSTMRAAAADKICRDTGCYASGSSYYNGGSFFGLNNEEILTMTVVPIQQPTEDNHPLKHHLQSTSAVEPQGQTEVQVPAGRARKFRSIPLVAAAATLCGLGRVF